MSQGIDVITWAGLLSGVVGSALAVLGTFTIALVTFRRTRRADALRAEVKEEERQEERRERVIAEVIGAFRGLEAEVRWAPLLAGRASARMLQATMTFYLAERRAHPNVANWLLHQKDEFDRLMNRWRRVWWMPFVRGSRLGEVASLLGKIIAVLVAWSGGDIQDDAFCDPVLSANALVAREIDSKLTHGRQ